MNDIILKTYILASQAPATGWTDTTTTDAENAFFNTPGGIGAGIGKVLGFIGIIVVLLGAWKVVTAALKGSVVPAVKTALGTMVIASFLFQPQWVISIFKLVGKLVGMTIESVTKLGI
jgi:hypothetical protein